MFLNNAAGETMKKRIQNPSLPKFLDYPELEFHLALTLHVTTMLVAILPFFFLLTLVSGSNQPGTMFVIDAEWMGVLLIRQWAMRVQNYLPGKILVLGGFVAAFLETMNSGGVTVIAILMYIAWSIIASLLFTGPKLFPYLSLAAFFIGTSILVDELGLISAGVQTPWYVYWFKVLILMLLTVIVVLQSHELMREIFENAEKQAEERRRAEQQLAAFTEREKVGRELHDGLGQILAGIELQTNIARAQINNQQVDEAITTLGKINLAAGSAAQDVRRHILGLQAGSVASDIDGLVGSLTALMASARMRYSIQLNLSLPEHHKGLAMPSHSADVLLKIVDEVIENAAHYSKATHILVTLLPSNGQLQVIIENNGVEAELPSKVVGGNTQLSHIQQRVDQLLGTLEIRDNIGKGTQTIITLPAGSQSSATVKPGQAPMRVLIADAQPLFLEGLRQSLTLRGALVVATATNGSDLVEKVVTSLPNIVLLDQNLPQLNGTDLVRVIKKKNPHVRVYLLATQATDEQIYDAIMDGVSGYLLKSVSEKTLFNAIDASISAEPFIDPAIAPQAVTALKRSAGLTEYVPPVNALTPQQNQILLLIRQGKIYKQIGEELGLSTPTIKYHVAQILRRLNVGSREEAIAILNQKSKSEVIVDQVGLASFE